MPVTDLPSFEVEVNRVAKLIDAPAQLLPTYGRTADFARPHIEFDGTLFAVVVVERGKELERHSDPDPNVILYLVFESVTFGMACQQELRQRRLAEDPRRQMFQIQLKLLGQLSSAWRARRAVAIDATLQRAAFRDEAFK